MSATATVSANGRAKQAPLPRLAGKIAYLCAQYPAISHTFVLREVDALRELGAEIETFSIRRSGSEQLLANADRVAHHTTFAILPPNWAGLLRAHLGLVLRAPSAYFATLIFALGLAPAGLRGRLWQLFYFVEAVVLWSELRRRDIRHIHAHLANVGADVALLSSHLGTAVEPERPWSWSFTMHGPTEFADVGYHRLAEKLRLARFVVCISDFARSQLMALSGPELWEKLHVVHVGVPIEQFTRSNGLTLDLVELDDAVEPGILYIGRLVPEKGQAVLLQAVARLVECGHPVSLTLAGEGPERAALERLAEKLGIGSRTSFLGAVGQEEIHALYARASIFCLPSFAEGVPVVLMEAMAMGLGAVSTRIAGIPELIDDGHTGLLVAPGRVDQLADALQRLVLDPSFRHVLGASSRNKVIREFNAQRSAEQLYRLFAEELPRAARR
jgi:colanic acid/amylovoran biosynthesis glycosyltransferase